MSANIAERSISDLIDGLITASIKCFLAQDRIMDKSLSDEERLEAAETAQITNARRNQFKRAIDNKLGEADIMELKKTYG